MASLNQEALLLAVRDFIASRNLGISLVDGVDVDELFGFTLELCEALGWPRADSACFLAKVNGLKMRYDPNAVFSDERPAPSQNGAVITEDNLNVGSFSAGDRVELCGLTAAHNLNGKTGVIKTIRTLMSHRFVVVLDSNPAEAPKAFREVNLRLHHKSVVLVDAGPAAIGKEPKEDDHSRKEEPPVGAERKDLISSEDNEGFSEESEDEVEDDDDDDAYDEDYEDEAKHAAPSSAPKAKVGKMAKNTWEAIMDESDIPDAPGPRVDPDEVPSARSNDDSDFRESDKLAAVKLQIFKILNVGLQEGTPRGEAKRAIRIATKKLKKFNLDQAEIMSSHTELQDKGSMRGGMVSVELRNVDEETFEDRCLGR